MKNIKLDRYDAILIVNLIAMLANLVTLGCLVMKLST